MPLRRYSGVLMAQDQVDGSRDGEDDPAGTFTGPSDREIIEVLKRVASAQAQLAHAGSQAQQATEGGSRSLTDEQCEKIDDAHQKVVSAQEAIITDKRQGRAQKALRAAEEREEALLKRFGFTSFNDYRRERDQVPTEDVHLMLATREFEAAKQAWVELQREMKSAVVVDLTGHEPRVID